MVNYKEILIGNGIFLAAILMSLIIAYMIPTIFTTIHDTFDNIPDQTVTTINGGTATVTVNTAQNDTFEGIGWIGIIIIWIISLLVMPMVFIIKGLTEETQESLQRSKLLETIKGILWFIFTILIVYFGKFWLLAFADAIPSDLTLLLIIYWTSVAIILITNVIGIPAYIIFKNKEVSV